MKCYTFSKGQLKEGIKTSLLAEREAVLLGQFVPGTSREFNMARCVKMNRNSPPKIEDMVENDRILPLVFKKQIKISGGEKVRCIINAFPKREVKIKDDGINIEIPTLADVSAFESATRNLNIIVRVKTFSEYPENNRRGGWVAVRCSINPKKMIFASGRGTTNGVTWRDDVLVLHDKDMIRVITAGSNEDDDMLIENINGRATMFPAAYYISSEDKYRYNKIQQETVESIRKEGVCLQ